MPADGRCWYMCFTVKCFWHLVGHHVEQRTHLCEVIDGFLQISEGLPLLQGLWELPDPETKTSKLHLCV